MEAGASRSTGAYQPNAGTRTPGGARSGAGPADAGRTEGAFTPRLEARLRAAAHVTTAPAPRPSGTLPPPPPTERPPAEVEAQLHLALARWQIQAQRILDRCVARPVAERKRVVLDVFFAPPATAGGWAVQRLAPVAVSISPHALRRLWRDTDPDELQGCLGRLRTLALPVPAAPKLPSQVLPASTESVLVQI